jgi:hypothetical protein
VLVLLNQMGAPRAASEEAADVERWRAHLAASPLVRNVLPLDAFARCWVQEGVLLQAVDRALGGDARMQRLRAAWIRLRLHTWQSSMRELAASLGRIAAGRVPLAARAGGQAGFVERLLPARRDDAAAAERALADALDREVRDGTTRLLELHGIEGRAQGTILQRVAAQIDVREPVHEGRSALLGGALSGALSGLAADLMSGGLTLGGGMLAGGLLGALGGAGVARMLNVVRGTGSGYASWSDAALTPVAAACVLRYLAVAHFGRGRGQWTEGEAPPHWRDVVDDALARERDVLAGVWAGRVAVQDNAGEAERLAAALEPVLARATRAALDRLYPDAWPRG